MDLKKIQEGFTSVGIKTNVQDEGPFYHGTKADLKIGDYLEEAKRHGYGVIN